MSTKDEPLNLDCGMSENATLFRLRLGPVGELEWPAACVYRWAVGLAMHVQDLEAQIDQLEAQFDQLEAQIEQSEARGPKPSNAPPQA
jgi:hypothetical protein